ncbi:efflux RND transporter permease subunit [Abyssibacter sp.]|uniref:efflux RND transporter permease subunit n=1 Tax=Abyssibacter sp. TaxID=2320200 RepID=UPI003518A8E0
MIDAIVRRGTLLTVAALVLCVLGLLAAFRVPVQMIPDLEVREISVRTNWPGATPQDVEKEILIEQEEFLRAVPNLSRLIAYASTGRAEIELEFPFGTDITQALIDVNNALSQVPAYPETVDEPRVTADSFSQNSFMYYRVVPLPGNPRALDMDMMRDFIDDNVRTRMERVRGVSQVDVRGGAERQIQIYVDPAALAERGISLSQLRGVIRERNRDISAGDLNTGKRRYLLRTVGRFDSLIEIEDLIIARQGDAVVRLRDVAEIRLDHFELRSLSYAEGAPAITLAVNRISGSNVISIKDAMGPMVESINREVLEPAGMRMSLTSDDVRYVEASVANVWKNLGIGAVLATLVLFLFLRSARATAVGVIGVPICTIAAFMGLLLADRTINVISLAGVAFAIGMTLDNTIVVLEAIERERRSGLNRFDSAVAGVKRVWSAVLASTLTTVLVFAPILFIEEEAGQLYSDIAVAISASILASMIVAITLVPTAAARLQMAENRPEPGRAVRQQVARCVAWLVATRTRRWTYLAGLTALVVGVLVFLTPPAEYLPEGEEPKLFARMIAPPGYNLDEMSTIADDVQAKLMPYVDDDPERYARGEADVPALAYINLSVEAGSLRIITETIRPSQIDALIPILSDLYESYPGMRAFVSRGSIITSNDGGTRSVNVDISGAELADIYAAAEQVYNRAREVLDDPQIGSQPSSLTLNQPLVEVRPDWLRVAELGLSAEELGFAVAALSDGAFVDEYFVGDDKVDIYLYSQAGNAQDLSALPELPIATAAGIVPISAVATLIDTVDTDEIRRVNGQRTVTLNIIAPRAVALETAVEIIRDDVIDQLNRSGQLPAGVVLDISGAADQLDATREALSGNFVVSLILCYLLLVAIFTHWGYPFVIMTIVPLGVAGGIGGLVLLNLLTRQPFDMISMLGFLILLGTVVNNPILIVDRTLQNLRDGQTSPQQAVTEAVDARLRPIMMSMITTVAGLSPLVFIPGAGTELYRGVGVIVLAGLVFSTVVTVTLLPVLLTTVLQLRASAPTLR